MTLLAADICASIDTLAMTYLDDELAEEELRDLELHLHDCAACRDKVEHERAALATLRRQLAPPPTPDVVRARLSAALDAEDALGARSRVTAWLLPAAASLVAAAALLLFVLGRPAAPQNAAAEVVADVAQTRPPKNAPVPVVLGEVQPPTVDRAAATWNSNSLGRNVLHMLFQFRSSFGDEILIQGSMVDGRGLEMCPDTGERFELRGMELCAAQVKGEWVIVHQDAQGMAYVFSSLSWGMGPRELMKAIVEHGLVDQLGAGRGR